MYARQIGIRRLPYPSTVARILARPTQARDMNKKPAKPVLVTTAEVHAALPKTQTIQLRLSDREKEAVKAAATACGRSVSEYLLECHRMLADKLPKSWPTHPSP